MRTALQQVRERVAWWLGLPAGLAEPTPPACGALSLHPESPAGSRCRWRVHGHGPTDWCMDEHGFLWPSWQNPRP